MTKQPIPLHAVTHLPGGSDPLPGGGGVAVLLGSYLSDSLVVPSGSDTAFSFSLDSGDAVLDLTTYGPDNPCFAVAGTYLVAATVACLDPLPDDPSQDANMKIGFGSPTFPDFSFPPAVWQTFPLGPLDSPAGTAERPYIAEDADIIQVTVNQETGGDLNFVCVLYVMKIEDGGGGGGGIAFDTDNEGGWLDIATNDADSNDYGMDFTDASGATNGIRFRTTDNAGPITLDPDGSVLLTPSQNVETDLTISHSFIIKNHSGTPIFQVDEDGTITPSGGGGIEFDTSNAGGYLELAVNSTDTNGYGMEVQDTGGGGFLYQFGTGASSYLFVANQTIVGLGSGGTFSVQSSGFLEIAAFDEIGQFDFFLGSGATFTLYDSSSNPMFQMTEGSPNLHIKTGGTVIADL